LIHFYKSFSFDFVKVTGIQELSKLIMKWTEIKVSDSPVSRSSHGISVIKNIVFMFGGEHDARTPLASDVYSFDLTDVTPKWTKVSASGEAPSARFGHGQCSVGESIYVFGGRMGTAIDEKLLNDLYKFDTCTNTWSRVSTSGHVPCPRSYHSMVSNGEHIYVFGGCPEKGRLADLHCLDTRTNEWSALETGPMEGRGGTPFAAIPGGELYVIGGFAGSECAGRETNDIHKYNIASNKWQTLEETIPTACSVAIAGSVGEKIVLVGGELEPSARGHAGAGNFSDRCTVWRKTESGLSEANVCQGPAARGWSSGSVWKSPDGGEKMVVVGGLTGDDDNPKRLIDVWIGA